MIDQALLTVFNTNYVAYYHAHRNHVNVVGRNFYQDHKLLQEVYEDLQEEIDELGELLRTIDVTFPETLTEVLEGSLISDSLMFDAEPDDFLSSTRQDLTVLIQAYQDLEQRATDLELNHLANYAQDRVRDLHKWVWMLKSSLEHR